MAQPAGSLACGAALTAAMLLGGCALFVDGLAAMSGKGGTIARSDQLEDTARRAAALAPGQPAPAWETVFPEEAPDFIEYLDSQHVLIGAVEVGAYLGVPSFRKIYLYDAQTGKALWQAERPDLVRGQYGLVATEPLIVLGGSNASTTVLIGLDRATGALRWKHEFKSALGHAVTRDDRLVVLGSERGALKLTAYALEDGQSVWSRDLAAPAKGSADLVAADQDLYVIGRQLTKLRSRDGAPLWSAALVELEGESASLVQHAAGLLVWNQGSLSLLDDSSGGLRWRAPLRSGGIKMIAGDGDSLYRVVTPDLRDLVKAPTASDAVEALDAASGSVRWSREVDGTIVSGLAADAASVMFTVEDAVMRLRADTGAVVFRQVLPLSFQEGSPTEFNSVGLPDIVVLRGTTLLVSRESAGVIALGSADGRQQWVQSNNSFGYSRPLRFGILALALTQLGVKPPAAGWSPSYTAARPNPQLQAHQLRMEGLAREQRAASQRAQQLGAKPGAFLDVSVREQVRGERARATLAADQQLAEAKAQVRRERQQANLEFALALSSALPGIVEGALKHAAEQGLVSRLQLELASTPGVHSAAFQGRYHVRPLRELVKKVRGVTLVELDSGRRSDLVFSPTVDAVVDYGLDLPHVAISPDGERLIAVGVGLRPEKYEAYVKGKVRIPRPSLMAFDTAQLRYLYRDVGVDVADAAAVDDYTQLVAAARKGNLLKVRRLLDRGADPNPKEATRFTPLIVAAESGNVELVRLLLSRGAKADYAFGGRSVIDFAKDSSVRKALSDAGAKPANLK